MLARAEGSQVGIAPMPAAELVGKPVNGQAVRNGAEKGHAWDRMPRPRKLDPRDRASRPNTHGGRFVGGEVPHVENMLHSQRTDLPPRDYIAPRRTADVVTFPVPANISQPIERPDGFGGPILLADNMGAKKRPVDPAVAELQAKLDADTLNYHARLALEGKMTFKEAAAAINRDPYDLAVAAFVQESVNEKQGSVTVARASEDLPTLPVGLQGVVEVNVPGQEPDLQPDILTGAYSPESKTNPKDVLEAAVHAARRGVVMKIPNGWELPGKIDGLNVTVFEAFNNNNVVVVDKSKQQLVGASN